MTVHQDQTSLVSTDSRAIKLSSDLVEVRDLLASDRGSFSAIESLKEARARDLHWQVLSETVILLREVAEAKGIGFIRLCGYLGAVSGYKTDTIKNMVGIYNRVARVFQDPSSRNLVLGSRTCVAAAYACNVACYDPERLPGILDRIRAGDVFTHAEVRHAQNLSAENSGKTPVVYRPSERKPAKSKPAPASEPAAIPASPREAKPFPASSLQPRVLTISEREKIRDLLETHFDAVKGMYGAGWSDQKIAEAVNVPRASVSQIRDVSYGPILVTPEMEALIARHKVLNTDIADLQRSIRSTEEKLSGQRSRETELLAEMRELKGQLTRMGIAKAVE